MSTHIHAISIACNIDVSDARAITASRRDLNIVVRKNDWRSICATVKSISGRLGILLFLFSIFSFTYKTHDAIDNMTSPLNWETGRHVERASCLEELWILSFECAWVTRNGARRTITCMKFAWLEFKWHLDLNFGSSIELNANRN